MKRVTGIGGIFFKAKDAPALQAWYKRHLGIDVQSWGGTAFRLPRFELPSQLQKRSHISEAVSLVPRSRRWLSRQTG